MVPPFEDFRHDKFYMKSRSGFSERQEYLDPDVKFFLGSHKLGRLLFIVINFSVAHFLVSLVFSFLQ